MPFYVWAEQRTDWYHYGTVATILGKLFEDIVDNKYITL